MVKEINHFMTEIADNKLVDMGKFMVAMKRALYESNLNFYLYNLRYGYMEWSVKTTRFRLYFPPETADLQLYYKHLEGDLYISYDANGDIIERIKEAINLCAPYDPRL